MKLCPFNQILPAVTDKCNTYSLTYSFTQFEINLFDIILLLDLSGQSLKALENAFGGGGIQTPENDGSVSVLSLDVGKNEAVKQVASRPTGMINLEIPLLL